MIINIKYLNQRYKIGFPKRKLSTYLSPRYVMCRYVINTENSHANTMFNQNVIKKIL